MTRINKMNEKCSLLVLWGKLNFVVSFQHIIARLLNGLTLDFCLRKSFSEWKLFNYKMKYLIKVHLKYIKVHMTTRWTIRHGLMLFWFTYLMNVTEEFTIHRPYPY